MKRLKRHIALLLALVLILPMCIGNGATMAYATETSSGEKVEDVLESNNEVTEIVADEAESIEILEEDEKKVEEDNSLNIEAIEKVVKLFEALPTVSDVEEMTSDEIDFVMQQAIEAMEEFDNLSYEECEYIINNYPELYNAVMVELAEALSNSKQDETESMSLLPLEEKKAFLVLNGKSEDEIKSMSIDDVLNMLRDKDGNIVTVHPRNATTVWRYEKDEINNIENYEKYTIGSGDKIDLSADKGINNYTMELIIGSDNQLDKNNVRYNIKVYILDIVLEENDITYNLYLGKTNGEDTNPVEPIRVNKKVNVQTGFETAVTEYQVPMPEEGKSYWLGMTSMLADHPDMKVKLYGFLDYIELLYGISHDPIMELHSSDEEKIIKADVGTTFMFACVYENTNTGESFVTFPSFSTMTDVSYIDCAISTYDEAEGYIDVVSYELDEVEFEEIEDIFEADGINGYIHMLKEGYSSRDAFYCLLNLHGSSYGDDAYKYVRKAVLGHYDSLEDASECEDIQEKLVASDKNKTGGYKAIYDGKSGGVDFTLFFEDGSVWKITVYVTDYNPEFDPEYKREYTDDPIIGESDPWFRVTGAKSDNGNEFDTYIIENGKNINIDTMYGYGYQTVFINDNVNSFIPTFWKADEEAISIDKIYANGSEFEEGDVLSFPNEKSTLDVVFSVIITDKNGTHPKNYDVTFVKKSSGPQLYIAGPLDPEVRSVFLDEYHENKHDIFIANIGDAPLKNLWLDLDATNVELDEYWTIGGEGNNTLAACPENFTLELDSTTYGELSNVAKIRLVPPASGKGGEINGTLKIYSGEEGIAEKSDLLATINLSDLAQNPEIITKNVDEAVKYVPYSYLITTNNMYDWVDVSYELTKGELPDGVELIGETGELYGVPTETGEFTFTVTTKFESTSENYAFDSSSVELTLTVKDNTDENVYNETDVQDGYEILDTIGADTNDDRHYILEEYKDTEFRSKGELEQFVDVWLNGKKLTRGETYGEGDYYAEDGSTKITVYSQTFENNESKNEDGRNTIAAEFRTKDKDSKNDKKNSNELKKAAQNYYVEKHKHSYDKGKVTKEPTCDKTGVRTYTCSSCGNKYTETIPALGHSLGKGQETKPVSCTENGEISYRCTRCNVLMKTDVVEATGHDYDVTITQGSDCKTDGVKTYKCKKCGDTYSETIKANGHKYEVKVTIEPSETEEGLRTFTCSACGDTFTEVIPALGDGTHLHIYNEGLVTVEPTCMELGKITYTCTVCGEVKEETLLSTGHAFKEEIILEATCVEQGMKELTCENCGEKYTEVIMATGHSYDNGVITKKPTAKKTGIKTYTCTVCGESYEEIIPMLSNNNQDRINMVVPSDKVGCTVYLVDENGNPIDEMPIELHSTPQYLITDSDGYARFNPIDFGTHTLYITAENGEKISKEFHLVSGKSVSLRGDTVTAEPGTSIVLKVSFDGTVLKLENVMKNDSPKTGDDTNLTLWFMMMLVSLSCMVVVVKYNSKRKYSR